MYRTSFRFSLGHFLEYIYQVNLFCIEIIACKGKIIFYSVDEFVSHFALLQLYSNHLVSSFTQIIEVKSEDGNHSNLLMFPDQEDGYFERMCTH